MKGEETDIWTRSVEFWDRAYTQNGQEDESDGGPEDWKQLAPSEKQFRAIERLSACSRLLDYGCGEGWASVVAAKCGCPDVTAADTAANCLISARRLAARFGVEGQVRILRIRRDWLRGLPSASFDGFFSSNVLDVVPDEVAEEILEGAARALAPGARLVISLNHCPELREDPDRGITVLDRRYLMIGNVLRLACYTDDEWTYRLGRRFRVCSLTHYA